MTIIELFAWLHEQPERVLIRDAPASVRDAVVANVDAVYALCGRRLGDAIIEPWNDRPWPLPGYRQRGMDVRELEVVQGRIEHSILFHMRHDLQMNAQLLSLRQFQQCGDVSYAILWLALCLDNCVVDECAREPDNVRLVEVIERCTGPKLKIYSEHTWVARGEPWKSMFGECGCYG